MPTDVRLADENGLLINTVEAHTSTIKYLSIHDANSHFSWWGRDFMNFTGSITTLSQDIAIGAVQLPIANTASVFLGVNPTGSEIFIKDGAKEETDHLRVTDITDTTIIIDRPLQNSYSTSSTVEIVHEDLSGMAGTLASPTSFIVQPPSGTIVDINRIIIEMIHDSAGDDSRFGNILGGIPNGVVLRENKANSKNILSVWRNNSKIKEDMFDLTYSDKAGSGLFSTSARWTFNSKGKDNFAIRLIGSNDDKLEILNQDDLGSLTSMVIKSKGNVVPGIS